MKVRDFLSRHPDADCDVTAVRFLSGIVDVSYDDANYIAGDYKAPPPLETNTFGSWFPLDTILVAGEHAA